MVEWYTHHVTGEKLNEGERSAVIKDYLTPDVAYAIIIQAVNDDGPGPYSNQRKANLTSAPILIASATFLSEKKQMNK